MESLKRKLSLRWFPVCRRRYKLDTVDSLPGDLDPQQFLSHASNMGNSTANSALRRVVRLVALLNLGYFFIEFSVALGIKSVSLFADSIDFLEDASVNLLIFVSLGWSPLRRARLGMLLAGILLIPGLATFWTAWHNFRALAPPEPFALSATGIGALIVNLSCALMLTRYRRHAGSLARAAFLSARNDVFANIAIVGVGLATFYTRAIWPDLVVGMAIALLNADAAREVYSTAKKEKIAAES